MSIAIEVNTTDLVRVDAVVRVQRGCRGSRAVQGAIVLYSCHELASLYRLALASEHPVDFIFSKMQKRPLEEGGSPQIETIITSTLAAIVAA